MAQTVPIREGLFESEAEGGRLLANRCRSCGQSFFPRASICFTCFGDDLEELPLSRTGRLYSYTIGQMPSTHFKPPYAVGLVDLPERVRVFAPLKMVEGKPLKVGMGMEVAIDELWQEDDRTVIGYKFKPA